AGVASLEHMSGVVQAASRNPAPYFRAHDLFLAGWTLEEEGWASLDSASLSRTARALAQTHVAIVPTLVLHETLAHLADTSLRSRPEMADVPDDTANVVRRVASLLRRTNWRAADFAVFQRARARQDLFVREFKRAGGLIAAGTDAANQMLVPGASLHEELLLLTEAGLSPLEAITAATRHAAQLLDSDSLGYLVPGKVADLVGPNSSPAQNIPNALADGRVLSKVTQGITTEITGEGGSIAPLTNKLVVDDSDVMKKYGFREDWRDLDGYFAVLAGNGSTVNIATFVGATQLRLAVVGKEDRRATPAELAHMTALVDTMMRQGALGVSTALEYAPAIYAPTEELIALARAARRHGGIYATHMRSEGGAIDSALDEVFRIAGEAGIPAEIWHLKVAGRLNWGRMPHVIA